ncbi:hypothetical protein EDM54_24255 [Brevibacillus borstelensis]|uniref:hypothetical protein n=1 Tax=Brevibacillus borstelensis TaxID=45462 RepID=UPI000F077CAB|nr:hypothetical protein [Brevibacillus borstelensis]MED1881993.1 hypothetical protein [Brevibacillus borstelensis]RNB56105.1 hypothetical protein EDM54_24255 [Brevibacillus borstelensis]GED55571.1 hypothetical protein BBO01nite_48120 [Brevibacillus borstelensis]
MALDLTVDAPWITSGAIKLGVFVVGLAVALALVNTLAPKWMRGILSAAVMLGGIYLFSLWLS